MSLNQWRKTRKDFDVIYYIYAILYSVRYRKVFAGYLDIAFPRIPYPKDVEFFQQLAKKGKELCQNSFARGRCLQCSFFQTSKQ